MNSYLIKAGGKEITLPATSLAKALVIAKKRWPNVNKFYAKKVKT